MLNTELPVPLCRNGEQPPLMLRITLSSRRGRSLHSYPPCVLPATALVRSTCSKYNVEIEQPHRSERPRATWSSLMFTRSKSQKQPTLGFFLSAVDLFSDRFVNALVAFFSSSATPPRKDFRMPASVKTRLILFGLRSMSRRSRLSDRASGHHSPPP
jgi:hypothetical protein